jgi:hypothetical protein
VLVSGLLCAPDGKKAMCCRWKKSFVALSSTPMAPTHAACKVYCTGKTINMQQNTKKTVTVCFTAGKHIMVLIYPVS